MECDCRPPRRVGFAGRGTAVRSELHSKRGFDLSKTFTLFFDVGGVLLSNAWDTAARDRVVEALGLDARDFHTRHGMVKTAFETGRLSLDSYIVKTVFHTPRSFTPDEFKALMFEQSQVLGDTLEWVRSLAETRQFRLFTLNNESRELHEYRVRTFGLCSISNRS